MKPTNKKQLLDLALFYCSQRETSRPKLRIYLLRKADLKQGEDSVERLLRILALTPHEVHDLAVAGRLAGMLPPDAPGNATPVRFADIAGWREPK